MHKHPGVVNSNKEHPRYGMQVEHPVDHVHSKSKPKAAHALEIAAHAKREKYRAAARKNLNKENYKKSDLTPLKDAKGLNRPSTMDHKVHEHFKSVLKPMIEKHQKDSNIPKTHVHKDFWAVAMPAAYRKLKETHEQIPRKTNTNVETTKGVQWTKKGK